MARLTKGAVLPVASALLLLTAPSAQAATLELDNASGIGSMASCQAFVTSSAGSGCFHAYGDYFYIQGYDTSTRVALYWKLGDGSRHGIIRWKPTDQYTKAVENKNLPEGKRVGIRFGVCIAGSGCDRVNDIEFLTGTDWTSTG